MIVEGKEFGLLESVKFSFIFRQSVSNIRIPNLNTGSNPVRLMAGTGKKAEQCVCVCDLEGCLAVHVKVGASPSVGASQIRIDSNGFGFGDQTVEVGPGSWTVADQ